MSAQNTTTPNPEHPLATAPYRILTAESIPSYLKKLPEAANVLGSPTELSITEIGDGNLNYVYRIANASDPSRSIILKQSVPYLRVLGESFPLSKERIHFEIRSMKTYAQIAPESLPEIYHADEEMCVIVMQDLAEHQVLRNALIERKRLPGLGKQIGTFLGKSLFATSTLGMRSEDRRALMADFAKNSELTKLSEDYIFTYPTINHPSNYINPQTEEYANRTLRSNSEYKLATLRLKEKFLTHAEALIHGDLHTGSLMASQTESKVIDWEFAFFGPIGFDIGKIHSNLFMNYISHYQAENKDYQSWLLEEIFQIWPSFSDTVRSQWQATEESATNTENLFKPEEKSTYLDAFLQRVLRDTAGFCACSLTRRTIGIGGVADIRDIEDPELRSKLEIINLQLAQTLMSRHQTLNTFDEFENLVSHFFQEANK